MTARSCVLLLTTALLSQPLHQVDGGKIFFPESKATVRQLLTVEKHLPAGGEESLIAEDQPLAAEDQPLAAEDHPIPEEFGSREQRGFWESDLFFLQKLSGLFGGDDEPQPQRRKTSNLRPEPLPPQILYSQRRKVTNTPGHHNQVKQGPRLPPRTRFPSSHQGSQVLRAPQHNNSPVFRPPRQTVRVTAPPNHVVPPPPDNSGQFSQNQQVAFHLPPPPPTPPKSDSNFPIKESTNFPYQFVRPGNDLPINNNILPHVSASAPPGKHLSSNNNFPQSVLVTAPPRNHLLFTSNISPQHLPVSGPPRADTLRPNLPGAPPPRAVSTHSNTLKAPLPLHSNTRRPLPPPPKTVKPKKPTMLGSLSDFSSGTFGNIHHPQKHPRPAPHPQRVIIPANPKPSLKKDFKPSLEFKPSPQEGKTASDAFQPVFVASPFMDDLGDDVMKPMKVASVRSLPVQSTTLPELQDFF
ncbi:uncharacterized protein [Procambarus clarkii]|uniref:uncharacterized protein n=1 Tax=Procambarus clarkii TaxID=6728 RepID=UPI0037425072